MTRRLAQEARDERGAILAMTAVWLTLLIMLVAFVVNVGDWFEHKRHLQLQVDAGAYAGGGLFSLCGSGTAADRASAGFAGNVGIKAEARRYAGDETVVGSFNRQVGGSHKGPVTMLLNSTTYANGQAEEPPAPTDTREPCAAAMLDVKGTEEDLPWFLGLSPGNVVPAINARARVEARTLESLGGALPIGVPDINPVDAAAILVDDDTGATIDYFQLQQQAPAGSVTPWDNSAAPRTISIPGPGRNLNVIVALAGQALDLSAGQTADEICAQLRAECFSAPGSGLSFVRGYDPTVTAPTPADPDIHEARLITGGGCNPDPYFSTAACSATLNVTIDFGVADPLASPVPAVEVKAFGAGCHNVLGCDLTYTGSGNVWTGTVSAPSGPGPYPIEIRWSHKPCASGSTCGRQTSTRVKVQKLFFGSSAVSGPVRLVQIEELDDLGNLISMYANTLPAGDHHLVVRVGVRQSLEAASDVSDPPVEMRLACKRDDGTDETGCSRTQALDCDPAPPVLTPSNFKTQLEMGCPRTYKVNQYAPPWWPCPSGLTGLGEPFECAQIATGVRMNDVVNGLNARFGNSTASCINDNNWQFYGSGGPLDPRVNTTDPRIVFVFLVPFGSFAGSGGGTVPVARFATFYVTGYSGEGSRKDPCRFPFGDAEDTLSGAIKGHFINYTFGVNNGGGGDDLCDFSSISPCVAVLTR